MLSLPAELLKRPAAHAQHKRLEVAVGALFSYLPAGHVRMILHTLSLKAVAAIARK
jgi:hypothetical protein